MYLPLGTSSTLLRYTSYHGKKHVVPQSGTRRTKWRNPFGTCILLTINALPLCFLLANGTFVAATVYGGNCKVFPGVPGADRGIYVFGSLYALRQYIFRVGGIYGIRIGTVDYIGRRIPLIVVSGGLPGDFPISVGQLPDVELRGAVGGTLSIHGMAGCRAGAV